MVQEVQSDLSVAHLLTQQVLIAAYTYLFLQTLQRWSDYTCQQVLRKTVSALTPGFSRVIIVNQVLPNTNATAFDALTDLVMMTIGAIVRTEKQWRNLLEGVGLHIVSIEKPQENSLRSDSVITAIVKPWVIHYPRVGENGLEMVKFAVTAKFAAMAKLTEGKRTNQRKRTASGRHRET